MKYLLVKVGRSGFLEALAQWKNTARADRPSPNELFFKRRIRLQAPVTKAYLEGRVEEVQEEESTTSADSRELRPFSVGTRVWVQDLHSKRWPVKAVIQSIKDTGRTYVLVTDAGEEIIRNRIYIRQRYV